MWLAATDWKAKQMNTHDTRLVGLFGAGTHSTHTLWENLLCTQEPQLTITDRWLRNLTLA
eukprot:m.14413 g.14413  ORF g.14413 m.14413 type:complete len:60 (-) comp4792_c0_seq2:459-638(-)